MASTALSSGNAPQEIASVKAYSTWPRSVENRSSIWLRSEGSWKLHGEIFPWPVKHTPANLRQRAATQAREEEIAEEAGSKRHGQRAEATTARSEIRVA